METQHSKVFDVTKYYTDEQIRQMQHDGLKELKGVELIDSLNYIQETSLSYEWPGDSLIEEIQKRFDELYPPFQPKFRTVR